MFTVDDIMSVRPCERWPRGVVEARVGNGVTATQIAESTDVSIQDRRWILTNLLARGPRPDRKALVRWACMCALDACQHIRDEYMDGVARACIETTLRWCDGDATIEDVRRDRFAAAYAAATSAAATSAAAYAAYAAYAYAYADAASAAYDAAYAAAAAAAAAYANAAAAAKHLRWLAAIIDSQEVA